MPWQHVTPPAVPSAYPNYPLDHQPETTSHNSDIRCCIKWLDAWNSEQNKASPLSVSSVNEVGALTSTQDPGWITSYPVSTSSFSRGIIAEILAIFKPFRKTVRPVDYDQHKYRHITAQSPDACARPQNWMPFIVNTATPVSIIPANNCSVSIDAASC